MCVRRGLAVACLKDGPMYALGGLDDHTCYPTVERYDSDSNTWSAVQDMNFPRGGVAVASNTVSVVSVFCCVYVGFLTTLTTCTCINACMYS